MAGTITASLLWGRPMIGLPGSRNRSSQASENVFTSAGVVEMDDSIDEFQRLRRLIPYRPDHYLNFWGRWRRTYYGENGYRSSTPGLECGGISSDDSFEIMCDEEDHRAAEITDTIIDDMALNHRIAIQHVYEAAVWNFRRMAIEDLIVEAAADFWKRAVRKGLV